MRARHLFALLAATLAVPAGAVELNVISAVEVADAGAEVVLTVKGTKRPSFTTFSMADEPRFVIDFSESRFEGVAAELSGAGGIVKQVKNLSYGSDASAIARVIIVFTMEVDPPGIEDSGTGLVVRIAKPAGAAAIATAPAPAAEPDAKAQQEAEAKAKADADAKAAAEAQAKADAEAKAKADAEAKAKADAEAKAKADAEAQAKADAEAQAKADAEAKAKADADAQAKVDAEAKAKADAEAQAKADAEAKAKADAEAQARADAEAKAKADADAKAKADAEAQAKADAEARAKAKADADAPTPQEDAEQKALEAEIAAAREEAMASKSGKSGKAAEAPALVAGTPPGDQDATPAREVERLSADAPPAKLREVGFKQLPGISRVFVRTSTAVQFRVTDVDDQTVQIEVENTRATRANDLRFLDTSFFPSAVQMIKPSRQGTSYVLTVKLRQRVPYAQKVVGDMVAVDFQRPPAAAAAEPAATPAPADGGAEPGAVPPTE